MERVCFRGAVPPPSLGTDWTQGWTYYNDTGAGRTDINYNKPLVIVQGDITTNTFWTERPTTICSAAASTWTAFAPSPFRPGP